MSRTTNPQADIDQLAIDILRSIERLDRPTSTDIQNDLQLDSNSPIHYRKRNHLQDLVNTETVQSDSSPTGEVERWSLTQQGQELLNRRPHLASDKTSLVDLERRLERVEELEQRIGEIEEGIGLLLEDEFREKPVRKEVNNSIVLAKIVKQMAIEKYGEDEARELFLEYAEESELMNTDLYVK